MTGIVDWNVTAGSNTTVSGVGINEGMPPSAVNNAMRAIMAEGKAGIIGFEIRNLALTASVGSSALTIAVKGADGNDPSGTNAVLIPFRNVTAATGTPTYVSLEAASSLVISSGSTLGTSDGVAHRIWVVMVNDGGTLRLGAVFNPGGGAIGDDLLVSTTAEGGAGGADTAGTIYTGSGTTSKAMRILGYVESTQATAGTWATSPSKIQVYNGLQSDFQDREIKAPRIRDYGITHNNVSSSGGTLTLDYSTGQSFTCTLTENITTFTVTNPPVSGVYGEFVLRLVQHASAAKTVTWGSAYHFPHGTDHVMSTGLSSVDYITMRTIDGGTIWYCDFSNNYS